MQYNDCLRILRKSFSIFLTLILIIICIAIVGLSKIAQREVYEQFGGIVDCKIIGTVEKVKAEEEASKKLKKISPFLQCYCMDELSNLGFNIINDPTCKAWLEVYLKQQSLNTLVIIIVPVLNVIISIFLNCNILIF